MLITHKMDMNLEGKEGNRWIEVSQWDTYTRHIRLALFTGPIPWTIPENVRVRIQYRKPDGTEGDYDTLPDGTTAWSAEGNKLTIRLAPQIFTVTGKVILQASILQCEKCLHTFAVEILVKPILEGGEQGEKSEQYTYLTGLLPAPETGEVGQYLRIAQLDNRGRVIRVDAADGPECNGTDVYMLSEGEDLSKVPENITMVIDSYGDPDLDFGTVKSINGVSPDESGNVEIALDGVKSVNGMLPDESGNVEIKEGGVKSVNGEEPDEKGNVQIEYGGVKTVNGVAPDGNGNVEIKAGNSSVPSDWNASENEPGHILNRPFYSKVGLMNILPETEAVYSENDGAFAIMNPISLEDGKEYTVRWNGVEYVCSAFAVDGVLPVTVLGLGDIGAMSGELSGDYPFFIMAFPDSLVAELGMGVGIYPLDGSTDLTISISGEAEMVQKLDGKYLPDGLPRSKIDNGTVLPETTGVYADGVFAMEGEMFVLVPGYEYTVTWNGVPYVCTATYTSFDGIRVTALGDINVLSGGEPTGTVPFVIVPVTLEMGLEAGFSALAIPTDGATSLTISITGAIETVTTIAEKYLPPSARTYVIQKIGLGALTAGATFTDMDVNYDVIADILYSGGSVQIEASGVRHFPVAWKYDTEENTLILYLGVPDGVQPCIYKFIKGTWTPPVV